MLCCDNPQIVGVSGKCSDLCHVDLPDGSEIDGYVPHGMGIGGGDYIAFSYCISCGKMVGEFPGCIPDEE